MRDLHIATGASYFEHPSNQTFAWPSLVNLLQQYDVGKETLEQYNALSKNDQLRAKDHGWFNGNTYTRAERLTELISSVDLLAFDIDNGAENIAEIIVAHVDPILSDDGFAYFVGSTRKHTPAKPRLRLVIPLSRAASIDEVDALKRMLAFRIGMKAVDPVTFRANQVMFWPSRCVDGVTFVQSAPGDFLDVDAKLAEWYPNGWERRETWPLHPTEERDAVTHQRKKAGDPHEKPGVIGSWCRHFTIEDVLAKFLPGVYEPGSQPDRYTHAAGTTADGAINYENKWMYSHHQTDPGSGRLLNSWDLVRVHKFAHLDAKSKPDIPIHRQPSSKAMENFAREQVEFKAVLGEDATLEFKDLGADTADALKNLAAQLAFNAAGKVVASHDNLVRLLRGHPGVAGALAYNHNTDTKTWRRFMPWHDAIRRSRRMDEIDGLPFVDVDVIRLRDWLLAQFRMELPALGMLKEAIALVADESGFHPIRDHLNVLPAWDGERRLDSLFVRYLNAADTPYHRAAARKFLIGAVARIMQPGIKFDTMLVLIGPQRIRKSAFLEAMCGRPSWFSDELPKFGKEAVEHIRALWFIEVAELAQFTRTEIEFVKAFLSRRHDRARLAYEENSRFFPRQCVFTGTTNNYAPLKDHTGNGRFLPIVCEGFISSVKMIDVDGFTKERDQIMAEALEAYETGERCYMTDSVELAGAKQAQDAAMPEDPVIQQIDQWLDGDTTSRRTPAGSATWSSKGEVRMTTCVKQIACEALGYDENGTDWPAWLASRIVDHMHSRTDWGKSTSSARIEGYGKQRVFKRFANLATTDGEKNVLAALRDEL